MSLVRAWMCGALVKPVDGKSASLRRANAASAAAHLAAGTYALSNGIITRLEDDDDVDTDTDA
jgi:hypothetical protein